MLLYISEISGTADGVLSLCDRQARQNVGVLEFIDYYTFLLQ